MKFSLIVTLGAIYMTTADFVAPVFDVDLDAPATDRWTHVGTKLLQDHGWDNGYGKVMDYLNNIIPLPIWEKIDDDLKKIISQFPDEYAAEVKGFYDMAVSLGYGDKITEGQIGFFQLFYEMANVCTSIVAQHANGTIFHARNLDYSIPGLENITATINFMKDGKVLFTATEYVGYFGVLTGMRPDGWSVSVNQRFTVEIPFIPTIEAMLDGAQSIGFSLRDALTNIPTYKEAMPYLSNTRNKESSLYLNSPVYLIVAGANRGEGTILTRKRNGTDESGGRGNWKINPDNGTWWRLETNDDNWKRPMDGRRKAANTAMEHVGVQHADLNHLLTVLSTPPVLAHDTTYTALMSAELGTYTSLVRTHDTQPHETMTKREIQLWRAVIDRWLTGNNFRGLADRPEFQL